MDWESSQRAKFATPSVMNSLRRRHRNTCYSVLVVIAVIATFIYLTPSTSKRSVPPLAGTYLYYHDVEYRTPNHKLFGAVNHADARFAPSHDTDAQNAPSIQETRDSLQWLLESYTTKMKELAAETWIAHGTLLGWRWGRHLMPWDTDVDVQMSYSTLQRLSAEHNGTRFTVGVTDHHAFASGRLMREYLFDVNPHFSLLTKDDVANHIDARWIDVKNGKYLDITAIHLPDELDRHGQRVEPDDNRLWCKDGHTYLERDLFPMQSSTLDDVAVMVPHEVERVLVDEYGRKSVTNKRHHWHKFNDKTQRWEPE